MTSLGHPSWLREFVDTLLVRLRVLCSILADTLFLSAWFIILSVFRRFAHVEIWPHDVDGWIIFCAAVLLGFSTLIVIILYLCWDIMSLALRLKSDYQQRKERAERSGGASAD